MKDKIGAFLAVAGLAGCASLNPWSGPVEQSRVPRDATVYQCEGGKTLAVRYADNGKSAMIILPEREFRLDQTESGRYSNGRTTLYADEGGTRLEEGQTAMYNHCQTKGG